MKFVPAWRKEGQLKLVVDQAIVDKPAITKLPAHKGYTLIEILVGLTIVGLIFGFGYANFRDFARRQSLVSATRKVKADLRLAQEQALAGKKPNDPACNPEGALEGYDFYLESATSYKIQAKCAGSLVDIKTVDDLPVGISLSASVNRIPFKVLGMGTNLATDATITITHSVTGSSSTVTVTTFGEIK